MSNDAHDWKEVSEKLRRAMGLCPPTPEEADDAIRNAGEIPMSEQEIRSIVHNATDGHVEARGFHPDHSWIQDIEIESVAEDSMLVMNRNPGADDDEVTREIKKLRKEALEEHDDEDDETELEGG